MKSGKYFWWSLICLLLAGCIVKPLPKVKVFTSTSTMDLLQEYQHYNNLSDHDFKVKLAEMKTKADTSNDPIIKLQLILMYLANEATPPDFTKVGSLLADIDKQETVAGDSVGGFIELLRIFIVEQKKTRMKLVGLHNKLQGMASKNKLLEQNLLDSQQQADILAKKIEQIKKIERIMSDRQDNKIVK